MTNIYTKTVVLPGAPDIMNANRHWRYRYGHAKKWKGWIVLAFGGADRPMYPLHRSRLTLTRCTSVEPDPDNLAACWKPVIDGLREAGVIVNDKSCNVELHFRWQKAAPGQKKVIIQVEELK